MAAVWRCQAPDSALLAVQLLFGVNYLAAKGMNVFSFLTLNIEGDDANVFPYLSYDERYRMVNPNPLLVL